jgi:hypothetical protein
MTSADTRSTERILLAIPVRVLGLQCRGGEFMEDTRTAVVNSRGARIALKHPVAVGDTLRIINLYNYSKADFCVVAPAGTSDQGAAEWGVQCLDPGQNIWGIEFAPPLKGKGGALVQCQDCHQEGFTVLTAGELEVLTTSGSLERPCSHCNKLTRWNYSSIYHPPREHEFGPGVTSPARPEQPGEPANRRGDDRRGLKQLILIRGPQGEEEVSKSENVSAGGFAVSLAMDLNVGDSLRVVSPYLAESQGPERQAVVRRRATHPFGGRRLFGLQLVS